MLPLACPAVDGDGKKANVREATPGLSALGIRAGKHALVTNVQRKEKVERSKLGNETRFPHQSIRRG